MFQYDDPLDAEDFDPVQYLNNRFPTEASLDDLDTFSLSVESKISAIEDNLSRTIQNQSRIGNQASKDIAEAQSSIQELFLKLNEIKSQASHSERMVQEICADIKKLDCAKNHLQSSITALKRLQMLITAIDQLEILLKDMQYKDMAHLLEAARQLMTSFEKYMSIPQIHSLRTRLESIQTALKRHVHRTFLEIGQLVESVADADIMIKDLPGNMKTLAEASLLVDALGGDVRKDVLDEFVIAQLNPYKRLFAVNMHYHTIEHTERRWAWFKRLLKSIELKFSTIWPNHWEVPKLLCVAFMELTREHTLSMLSLMEADENKDVSVLLKALQTTLRFEQEMESKFGAAVKIQQQSRVDNPNPFSDNDDEAEAEGGDKDAVPRMESFRIKTLISEAYEDFLDSYVTLERQNLDEMLEGLKLQEDVVSKTSEEEEYGTVSVDATPSTGGNVSGVSSKANVYDSSIQMFVFIKNSIKRCTTLTTGKAFLLLSQEFKRSLKKYSDSLKQKGLAAAKTPTAERSIAYLINTAEYCSDVVPRLESMIKAKIKEELADKVDLSPEVDVYMDLVVDLIKVLASMIQDRLEPSYRVIANTNWTALTQVTEESAYLQNINAVMTESIGKIQPILSDLYFKNFCSRVANDILAKFLDLIFRQRTISELTAQQLLLDLTVLKSIVLGIPKMGGPVNENALSSYVKVATSRINQIDAVLKLVTASQTVMVERFVSLMPEGVLADVQAIMALKGMKKQDQQQAIDAYQTISGTQIKATSLITSGADNFPLVVSIAAVSSAAAASSSISSSMRNLTTDLTFSVQNLKWTNK